MDEFQEIFITGGKITFKKEKNDVMTIGIKHSNPWAMVMFQVCVSYDAKLLDTVPFVGLGQPMPPYPKPSILVWLISDREGLFGRRCPKCNSYFRTDACPGKCYCPYCGYKGKNVEFTTENQLKYIAAFCNLYLAASRSNEELVLDLDKLAEELPNNKPAWFYSEEKQQYSYKCPSCSAKYDILGEYSLCPGCGKPNFIAVYSNKMDEFEKKFKEADEHMDDRAEREMEWEKLTRCVSEFESMANELRKYLLLLPATPQRKSRLKALSFQNIVTAHEYLKHWYGFELLEGFSDSDKNFINKMFNRRHIFIHKGGRVDQEYIENTGDTSVRLNQVIKFRSREICRLIPLVLNIGVNLIHGFESIS